MGGEFVFLCFINEIAPGKYANAVTEHIESFDRGGYDVRCFGIPRPDLYPPDTVLTTYNSVDKKNDSRFVFLTDIPELFKLVYRLYHGVFSAFAFVTADDTDTRQHDRGGYLKPGSVYAALLDDQIRPEERTFKPVFCNETYASILSDDVLADRIRKLGDIFNAAELGGTTGAAEDDGSRQGAKTVFYLTNDRYYTFYPTRGNNIVIDLDEKGEGVEITNGVKSAPPNAQNTVFGYYFNRGVFRSLIEHSMKLQNDIIGYNSSVGENIKNIEVNINAASGFEKDAMIAYFELLASSQTNIYFRIYLFSVLTAIADEAISKTRYLNAMLKSAVDSDILSPEQKYFIYYQCVHIDFVDSEVGDSLTCDLFIDLYRNIYGGFKAELNDELEFIPKEKRIGDTVLVFTGQFLGIQHAPTQTALDRCHALIKRLNAKNTLLINTSEVASLAGVIPFNSMLVPTKGDSDSRVKTVRYKDADIPVLNMSKPMPSVNGLREIITLVKKCKPYYAIGIGGSLMSLDICASLVPSICISTVFSGMAMTESQFQVIGRKTNSNDLERLSKLGFDREHIIESVFTFAPKPQKTKLNRGALGLPNDKFLLLVVGARLDSEITAEFWNMLKKTFDSGTHVVLAGVYEKYETVADADPDLRRNSTFIGFTSDILAVCELCDLYVNPKRAGGGSSVVEAMLKGLPAVTLRYGDVYAATDDDFTADGYDEMAALIMRYARDKEFYDAMSKMATERARVLTDTDEQFEKIISAAINSKLFK